ncbi:MAG TPA: ABC transporter permease [Candidatus Binatia bacterium]|jgi:ABC-type nitrate/sulfonate/bicarbonate transport system permease component
MNASTRFNWPGWLTLGAILLFWEVTSRAAPKLQLYIPPVSQILWALGQLLLSGAIAKHLGVSLTRFLQGYLLAAAMAVSLGIVLGYFRSVHSWLDMLIEFLRPMPSVAIIPVAILILGIGDSMIVAVTVYASVWPILINTIDGVRHIESTLIDTGRTFGLSGRRILWQIILPGASSYIVTGLRIGLSIALILVTTAEMIVGSKGLGFFILDEERSMNSGNMYAGIILVAVLGYALNRGFLTLEAKAMKWHRGMIAREAA